MKVSKILDGIKYATARSDTGDPTFMTLEAGDITADSRRPESSGGMLFFAYKGANFDSHDEALRLYNEGKIIGAVVERPLDMPSIVVEDGRRAFSLACANFFGKPETKLKTVAVTGTNGKTTVTWLLEKIFSEAGMPCVRIGTTGANIPKAADSDVGEVIEIDNTTPSPYDFYKFLAAGVQAGAKAAVAEVSSHALDQDRLFGIVFDVAIFTNLTGDHLDYHKDSESYYQAKKKLFTDAYSYKKVINIANVAGQRLYDEAGVPKTSFAANDSKLSSDIRVSRHTFSANGTQAVISCKDKDYSLDSPLVGEFNLENILAAVAGAMAAGVIPEVAVKAAGMLENVPGRLERYSAGGISVFVDFAHTDDALENVLETLRMLAEKRLITVFGAGGDRDKTKRPRMGKIAQRYSDLVVVTSDNPRTEEPARIIADITAGMSMNESVRVVEDREKAIAYAIAEAEAGDIVVIAGKGHESYQIIGAAKHHFSDSEMTQKYLGMKK
jgi:UDP-N-acetylmuramoyl-L-alanyl-D-glutamate--2,6-diaminopimelate ligase